MNTSPIRITNRKKYIAYTPLIFDLGEVGTILYKVELIAICSDTVFKFNQN